MVRLPDRTASQLRPGRSQIHSLTALRGLAAWWVVLFHFDLYLFPSTPAPIIFLISKGYLAVDLFFVLSGFVIFLNYGDLAISSAREIWTFYLKRFAKVYPLHLFTICLYLLLIGLMVLTHRAVPQDRYPGRDLLLNLFLIQDWGTSNALTWNVPSWSISAEFAAYLLFPVLVILLRAVSNRIVVSLLLAGIFLALLNFFFWDKNFQLGAAIPGLGVIRCVAQFAMGAILARLYSTGASFTKGWVPTCCFVIAAVFLLAGMMVLESILVPLAWMALVFAIACTDRLRRFLNHPWLVFVGEISYATYMIHYFVRDVFKLVFVHAGEATPLLYVFLAFLVILAVSIPIYLLIERPAQKFLTAKAKLKPVSPKVTSLAA